MRKNGYDGLPLIYNLKQLLLLLAILLSFDVVDGTPTWWICELLGVNYITF